MNNTSRVGAILIKIRSQAGTFVLNRIPQQTPEWIFKGYTLFIVLSLVIVFGGFTLAPYIISGMRGEEWIGLSVMLGAYAAVLTMLVKRNMSYLVRSYVLCFAVAVIGYFSMISIGLVGSVRLWFLCSAVLACLLVGGKSAFAFFVISLIVFIGFGYTTGFTIEPPSKPDHIIWIIASTTFVLVNIIVVGAAYLIMSGLKKADVSLRESEALLSQSQKMAHIGSWKLDLTINSLVWSDEVYHIFGCEPHEFAATYEAFLSFIHPDDRAAVDDAYSSSLREGRDGYEVEHRIIRRDSGEVRYVHERCYHERDDAGTIIQSTGMVQDITERKQAEERQKAEEENLRITLNSIGDGVISTDNRGRITRMNPVAEKLCGWISEDACGKPLAEVFNIINSENRLRVADPAEKVLKGGKIIGLANHTVLMSRNGKEYQIADSAAPIKSNEGVTRGVVLVFSDVTEKYMAQKQIKESELKLNALFTSMTEMVVLHELVFDSDGKPANYRIIDCNDAFTKITGIARDDAVGRLATEVYGTGVPPYLDEYAEVALSGEPHGYDSYFPPMDKHFAITVVSPEKNRFATITQDITERRRAEEVIQTQLAEKETLLREVHHRVKNNMATIESFVSLQTGLATTAEVKSALQDVISRVQSMRVLYDNLLLSPDLHEVSMQSYAEDLINSLLTVLDPEHTVATKTHITDFEIGAKQAFSLGIIINELLTNVFKYAFKDRGSRMVSISIAKEASSVMLTIRDNGVGFDERALKNESPGFGLTVVRMLVEETGGTYTMSNDDGAKSVVQFDV